MPEPQRGLEERLEDFDKRGWTLKPYKLWGPEKPCPPRLVVNVYKGCAFAHTYCYISGCARAQKGFREHLTKRIAAAKKAGLEKTLVILSSSTDPFQPIEQKQRDSLFALDALLTAGFPVLVMTRNPQMLREKEYEKVTGNPNLYVDVSVPSLQENNPQSIFYSAITPPLDETFAAMRGLAASGKYVRVKIEPVVPTTGEIEGQTPEEIGEIVRRSKEAGVQQVISKTMRMNDDVPARLRQALWSYYQANGEEEHYGRTTNLVLRPGLQEALLRPVFEACREYGMPFCACVDADVFQRAASCRLRG